MTDQADTQPDAGDELDPRFAGETIAGCSSTGDDPADPDAVGYALAADGIDGADAGPVADEGQSPQQDGAVGA